MNGVYRTLTGARNGIVATKKTEQLCFHASMLERIGPSMLERIGPSMLERIGPSFSQYIKNVQGYKRCLKFRFLS